MADWGDGYLFKDVGHDLQTIANQTIVAGTVGLRTAIAREAISTHEGQQVAAEETGKRFMPYLILAVALLLVFVFGRAFLR